ncbi:MAG TPA: hypothetical protein VEX86_06225 [Longimicrobium sp.]|nr:hypothetical protein [Longimicrobium sp.]
MTNRMVLLLVAASSAAAPAAAQQRSNLDVAALRAAPAAPEGAPLRGAAAPQRATRGRAASRTAIHALGGAVLGAGAGYLASQVAWSDWDKSSNSDFANRRVTFAVGGSAVGALAGLVLGRGAPSMRAGGQAPPPPAHAMGAMVTSEQLRASAATTLYELLQATHPTWLRGRGEGALRAGRPDGSPRADPAGGGQAGEGVTALPAQTPSDQAASSPAPKVYLDGGFVGDVNQLRQMLVSQTESVQYFDVAQATYRFGPGHQSGAILVKSLGYR